MFPKDDETKQLWIKEIRRQDWVPSTYCKICSEHFEEKCFDRSSPFVTLLKPGSIPTIFPGMPVYMQSHLINELMELKQQQPQEPVQQTVILNDREEDSDDLEGLLDSFQSTFTNERVQPAVLLKDNTRDDSDVNDDLHDNLKTSPSKLKNKQRVPQAVKLKKNKKKNSDVKEGHGKRLKISLNHRNEQKVISKKKMKEENDNGVKRRRSKNLKMSMKHKNKQVEESVILNNINEDSEIKEGRGKRLKTTPFKFRNDQYVQQDVIFKNINKEDSDDKGRGKRIKTTPLKFRTEEYVQKGVTLKNQKKKENDIIEGLRKRLKIFHLKLKNEKQKTKKLRTNVGHLKNALIKLERKNKFLRSTYAQQDIQIINVPIKKEYVTEIGTQNY